MRLNGWQRIGIVGSVIWVLIGGFLGNKAALDYAGETTKHQLDACVSGNRTQLHLNSDANAPYGQIWTPCWNQFNANYMKNAEGHWWGALIVGLVPIPFAWLIGWCFVALLRWIRAGFSSKPSN
jgi:hypothetical protein